MNVFTSYALNLFITILIATLLSLLLRSALRSVLLDLCGTPQRAHFWTLFAMILLIAMPVVIGMGYTPQAGSGQELFFEMSRQLRGNLLGYLFTLGSLGFVISVFSLFAPKPRPANP